MFTSGSGSGAASSGGNMQTKVRNAQSFFSALGWTADVGRVFFFPSGRVRSFRWLWLKPPRFVAAFYPPPSFHAHELTAFAVFHPDKRAAL
jgi:hypothetical protein